MLCLSFEEDGDDTRLSCHAVSVTSASSAVPYDSSRPASSAPSISYCSAASSRAAFNIIEMSFFVDESSVPLLGADFCGVVKEHVEGVVPETAV